MQDDVYMIARHIVAYYVIWDIRRFLPLQPHGVHPRYRLRAQFFGENIIDVMALSTSVACLTANMSNLG